MDNYVTGAAVRKLREGQGMTQEELAARIHVSAKAVSKWETGKGFPDVSLLEPLAAALGISVIVRLYSPQPEPVRQYAPGPAVCLPGVRQCHPGGGGSGGQLLRDYAAPAGSGGS